MTTKIINTAHTSLNILVVVSQADRTARSSALCTYTFDPRFEVKIFDFDISKESAFCDP